MRANAVRAAALLELRKPARVHLELDIEVAEIAEQLEAPLKL